MAIDKQVQPQPLPTEIPTDGPIEIELELPMQEGEEFADVLEMPQGENFSENLCRLYQIWQFLRDLSKKIPSSDILPRPGSALDFAFILIIVWC